jgi:hypothetical protein
MKFLISGLLFALLTATCLWNAFSNYRALSNLRKTQATVIASKLLIDWNSTPSDSREHPLYILTLDLVSTDSTKRHFHWEGDPGQAAYPEEALDELAQWNPGSLHQVSMLRGDSRELRFDQLESDPEWNKCILWSIGAGLCGFSGLVLFMLARVQRQRLQEEAGVWVVFVTVGLITLLAVPAVGRYTTKQFQSFEPIELQKLEHDRPFDTSQIIPDVSLTPKAKEKIAKESYDRYQYVFGEKTYHLGKGYWYGVLDSALKDQQTRGYAIHRNNRWEIAHNPTWTRSVITPTGMTLLFAIVFLGAGLAVRPKS